LIAGSLIWVQQWLLLQAQIWALPFGVLAAALVVSRRPQLALIGTLQLAALASGLAQTSHQQLAEGSVSVTEFRVVSEPQRWGSADRQFIELPSGVRGYINPAHSVQNGASYRAALRMRPLPTAERGAFVAQLSSSPEQLTMAPAGTAFFSNLRASFLSELRGLSEDSAALVAGLAIGERDLLSGAAEHNMKQLSLTHLVAVSGANLAIVMGAVYLLTRALMLPRRFRFLLAGAAAAGYIAIVGPEPSVLRAAAMAYAVLLAAFLGRAARATQALGWSMVFLVTVDPWLAADFAFALSVLATAGLIILGPAIFERLRQRLPDWLSLAISVTTAAQLYTLPVLLLLQPGLPTYSILANIIVEPVVAPVTILGISSAVISPWLGPLAGTLSWLASLGTFWIELVATELVQWPGVRASWPAGALGVALTVGFAWLATVWLRDQKRWGAMGAAAVLVFAAAWVAPAEWQRAHWPGPNWQIAACDVGQGDAFVVRSAGQVAIIDLGPDGRKLNDCLRRLKIDRVDLLVITHFDFDHAGAIDALQLPVTKALISGFQDDRALASTVLTHLDYLGAEVATAHPGLAAMLGDVSWRVLAPTLQAAEAKDANDASVVVLFDGADFAFLTLGDLSEQGQLSLLQRAPAELAGLANKNLILKVSHHGSKDQSDRLHRLVSPQLALVSVGRNRFGHPDPGLMADLTALGSSVARTDLLGHISVSVAGSEFVVKSAGRVER
jgi:competence protein ComEC